MAACEGLVQYDKTGVSTALNAVLELYAGKLARTVLRGPRFREEMRLPSRGVAVVSVYLKSDAGKLGRDCLVAVQRPRLSDGTDQQYDVSEGLVLSDKAGIE